MSRPTASIPRQPRAVGPAGETSSSARETLSVVIITKNEESRIGRCLESVRWVDEIVVVDGMSTDRTVEICRQFGARVIPHAFEGSFAKERNIGMEQATGDWVLQIDADDVVTPALDRFLAAAPQFDGPRAKLQARVLRMPSRVSESLHRRVARLEAWCGRLALSP